MQQSPDSSTAMYMSGRICAQGLSELPRISALEAEPNLPHIDSYTLLSTLEQAEHALRLEVKHTRFFLFFFLFVSVLGLLLSL